MSYAKAASSLSTAQLTNEPTKGGVDASSPLTIPDATKTLVEMLVNLGCSDPLQDNIDTLPRGRDLLRPNIFEVRTGESFGY